MVVFPNAKINIGLNITTKRDDGFHNISSFFYPIGWCDILEIIPARAFCFSFSGKNIPFNKTENICVKAYNLVKFQYNIPNVHIHLHKIIPIGSGLGGGSSDAAFTIKLLNSYYKLNISIENMEKLAGELGSDCPFFIRNTPCYVMGKGEILTESTLSLSGKYIILIYPNISIATAKAYKLISPKKPQYVLNDVINKPIEQWKEFIKNDFQEKLYVQYPIIGELIELLYKKNALFASMTGSGSTVYGIFDYLPSLNFPKDFTVRKEKLS